MLKGEKLVELYLKISRNNVKYMSLECTSNTESFEVLLDMLEKIIKLVNIFTNFSEYIATNQSNPIVLLLLYRVFVKNISLSKQKKLRY